MICGIEFKTISMPARRRRPNIGRNSRIAVRVDASRRTQSESRRIERNETERERARAQSVSGRRRQPIDMMNRVAFNYDCTADYSMYRLIGVMVHECQHCNAQKFPAETPGMCCANGKVRLPELAAPIEPLNSLLFGISPVSNHFRQYISEYNACFQMTSFGATKIIRDNFMPTFKVK